MVEKTQRQSSLNPNMPAEIITLYTKDTPHQPQQCERGDYYQNDFTTYRNHYPALIDVFLFNAHGDMLLQKRSRHKRKNPGRLHTTVGGHINWGESPAFAVTHECMEELGAPSLVFPKADYAQAFAKLHPYTKKVALLCEINENYRDHTNDAIESRRNIKDRIWLYFGRYDGPVEIPDRDCSGYEWIDLATLKNEFASKPEAFTDGIRVFVETHENEMQEFIRDYCRQ